MSSRTGALASALRFRAPVLEDQILRVRVARLERAVEFLGFVALTALLVAAACLGTLFWLARSW